MKVTRKYKNELGNIIRQLRVDKELSQRKLASALEVTNAALSDIENGNIFPSEGLLIKVIYFLSPPKRIREEIYNLFSEAKGVPPPDISLFLKNTPFIHPLLRELLEKNVTFEDVAEIRVKVKDIGKTYDI